VSTNPREYIIAVASPAYKHDEAKKNMEALAVEKYPR
jgi:hypothetical protein